MEGPSTTHLAGGLRAGRVTTEPASALLPLERGGGGGWRELPPQLPTRPPCMAGKRDPRGFLCWFQALPSSGQHGAPPPSPLLFSLLPPPPPWLTGFPYQPGPASQPLLAGPFRRSPSPPHPLTTGQSEELWGSREILAPGIATPPNAAQPQTCIQWAGLPKLKNGPSPLTS